MHEMIQNVATMLQHAGYRFEPSPLALLDHECLPLQHQVIIGLGKPRQSDGQVHLARVPTAPESRIQDILADRKFAGPYYIEDNRYVLYLSEFHFGYDNQFAD